MKILLMSDIHSNLEALEVCLDIANKRNIDRINVLGDIIGYMYDAKPCIDLLKKYDSIMGNHECAIFNDNELKEFNDIAKEQIYWTRKQLTAEDIQFIKNIPLTRIYQDENYTIAHGTFTNPFDYMTETYIVRENIRNINTNLLFVGHTHKPMIWECTEKYYPSNVRPLIRINGISQIHFNTPFNLNKDKKYVINVGAVGQPRDKNPLGCCVLYDTDLFTIEFIRFEYPIEKTIQKLMANNFHPFLSERLRKGI